MDAVKTDTAAVERLADVLANSYPYGGPTRTEIEEAAATLRALAAENAALREAAAAARREAFLEIARWIEPQRNDVPMTGKDAAAAIVWYSKQEPRR